MHGSFEQSKVHPVNRISGLNFMLDANRNLLLGLASSFSLMIFAAAADALDFRDKPTQPVTGILSGISGGVGLLIIFVVCVVHAYMVYEHSILTRSLSTYWFLLPILMLFAGWVPIISYLIILYV